jgi:hypothetical protein
VYAKQLKRRENKRAVNNEEKKKKTFSNIAIKTRQHNLHHFTIK